MKASIRVQRIVGTLSRMRSRISITFKCIFYICDVYTYIQKISYFHVFFEKDRVSFSVQRKNIIFSRKKNNISPDNTRKIIFKGSFFREDCLFGAFEENIIFSCIFFEKNCLLFSV